MESLLTEYEDASTNNKEQGFVQILKKKHPHLLTFLRHHRVPFDKNATERAIRNIKIKTKVSDQFKSDKEVESFAIVRSIIDTT